MGHKLSINWWHAAYPKDHFCDWQRFRDPAKHIQVGSHIGVPLMLITSSQWHALNTLVETNQRCEEWMDITSGIKSTPGRVAEAVSTRAVKILWKFHEAKLQQQQSKTRRWHQTTTTRYDITATWHAIWDQSVDTRSGGHLQWQVPSSELRKRELEVNAQVKNKLRSQDKEILRYDTSWLHVIMNIYYE